MKNRQTFRDIYLRCQDVIMITLLVIWFIGSFIASWNIFAKPLSDSQFEMCKQVAQDVYEQRKNVLIEIPEGYKIDITQTEITVYTGYFMQRVIAKLQNGSLVFTKSSGIISSVVVCVCSAILSTTLFLVFLSTLISFIDKKKK